MKNPDRLVVKHYLEDGQVTIHRDKVYPTMWRVPLPNGGLSDMVNLARAKDAAKGFIATKARRNRATARPMSF